MNEKIKIRYFVLILFLGLSFSAYAQMPDLKDLQKGVANFSEDLAKSLPFNSSMGLNWSDAYIGKFFPSLPPHFGVGMSFGFTTMKLASIETLAGYLGYKIPFDMTRMPLPAYTVEGRMGGILLPFDVGFKFGYLPPVGLWGSDTNMDYLLVGGDIRYVVLDKAILPKISVGMGINYLKGGIGAKVGKSMELTYYDGGSQTIALEKPELILKWDTVSLDFKTQVSKSFLIITPYLGLGMSYAWSSAGYSVDTKVSHNGNPIEQPDIDTIKAYLRQAGLEDMDVDSSGISSIIKNSAFSFRLFGGLSLNLTAFRVDLTGLYSFRDSNIGASLGFRFQL